MSWYIPAFIVPKGTQNFSELIDSQVPIGQEDVEEAHEAANGGKSVAKQLIASGAYGDWDEHAFYVTISGHANPGNVAPPGWSDDFISINIRQTKHNLDGTPLE
jgi:hypothetical protein